MMVRIVLEREQRDKWIAAFNAASVLARYKQTTSVMGCSAAATGIIAWAEYPMMELDVDAPDSLDRVRETIEREKKIDRTNETLL